MAKHLTKPIKCCIYANGNSKEERLCRRPPLLHEEDGKQKKNFTEEELSITSTSALSFSPLTVIISLADRWPSPALVISRAVAMRHAGALPVLYGLLVPWGRGLLPCFVITTQCLIELL